MTPESSRKKLIRELLGLLSEKKESWWRSSPNLFSSESESESDGKTKPLTLVPPTQTPKEKYLNISGTWPLEGDSSYEESRGAPPDTLLPPRHPPLLRGNFLQVAVF
ncbi:ORF3 [Giant panda anellovirus]|uniref:ORF3 n=1 Tax=Giant panda anellovirus TaxID=2016460 RepID=A0A220IGI7_9VIRU|nr:ORF3 [Giant panda anellovirus]ASH99104.1 ORF3 [Giant panda anellovirus]